MEKQYKDGNHKVKPNTITYNSVANAWAKSGESDAARKAEAIVQKMADLSQNGDNDVKPNLISFTTVLDAWSRSDKSQKGKKAKEFLRILDKLHKEAKKYGKPDRIMLSSNEEGGMARAIISHQ